VAVAIQPKADPETRGRPLKRSMGLWMATALVIGNMVGSGIFTLPAVLAGEAGPASILSLAFTGVGAMLLALVFANLGRAHPRTGGPYYFARRAFGDFVGFQTAWAYWIAAWVGNAAIAVAFAGYLGVFWGSVETTNWVAALVAVAAVWLFTIVNILGARQTGVAQVVTTVLKFVLLRLCLVAHDEDRARGGVENGGRDASEHDPLQRSPTVGAEHDQIGRRLGGGRTDLVDRVALAKLRCRSNALLLGRFDRLFDDRAGMLAGRLEELRRVLERHIAVLVHRNLPGGDDSQLPAGCLCEVDRVRRCFLRGRRAVSREQNRMHGAPLSRSDRRSVARDGGTCIGDGPDRDQ
jgi:hypothetical protein